MRLWIIPITMAVACAGAYGYWWYKQHTLVVASTVEASDLAGHGMEVIASSSVDDLIKRVDKLVDENKTLKDALEAAKKAAPGARVVQVVKACTEPEKVPVASKCLLAGGDEGEVRVNEIQLQTEGGNKILIGTAEAWRLNPPARLFGGKFSAATTEVGGYPGDLLRPSKWGIGSGAVLVNGGIVPELVLAAPAFRVLGLELSPILAAGWGAGLLAVVVRP
jgi:hypothetical protein